MKVNIAGREYDYSELDEYTKWYIDLLRDRTSIGGGFVEVDVITDPELLGGKKDG